MEMDDEAFRCMPKGYSEEQGVLEDQGSIGGLQ